MVRKLKLFMMIHGFEKSLPIEKAKRKLSAPQNASQHKLTLQFDSDEDISSNTKPVTSYKEPRRQDVRKRYDDKHNPDDRRCDDSRERHRPNDKRTPDDRRRPDKHEKSKKPTHEPRIPYCLFSRERFDNKDTHNDQGLKIDYRDITIPFRKNRNYTSSEREESPKKTLKI